MTTNFPTSLQDLDTTRGASGNPLNSPNHITHHQLEDDTIEALEAKVGITGSLVTTSHDYKLSGVMGSDKAVSKTGSEVLTNKTLTAPTITSPIVTLGSDATGDIYYRNSGGAIVRLGVSTDGKILRLASGIPSWDTETVQVDSSYSVKGIVKFLTDAATSGITVSSGVANVNFGTGANQIVKLDGSSKLPAVDGSQLTNLSAASIPTLPYSINTIENVSSWYTIQIQAPFSGSAVTESFWTIAGTTTQYATGAKFNTTGDHYANAILWSLLGGSDTQLSFASTTNLRLKWVGDMAAGTDISGGGSQRTGFTGFTETATTGGQINGDITVTGTRRVGFGFYNGLIYAITCNGTNITATSLGAYTANASKLYEIVLTGTTSALFYINGSLVATNSTNLPSANNLFLDVGWNNTTTGTYVNFISDLTFSQSV